MNKIKKRFLILLKIIVSFGLLFWVIKSADYTKILSKLIDANIFIIIVAVLLFIFITYFLSLRWYYLSFPLCGKLSKWNLFKYFLYTYFFNNFLPTSIGGDIVRGIKIGQDINNNSKGLATVFIDRLSGIWAVLTFAVVGLMWTANYFRSLKIVYFAVAFAFCIFLLIYCLLNPQAFSLVNKILKKITILNFGERILKIFNAIHFYNGHKIRLLVGYLFSLVAQIMVVYLNYLVGLALGVEMSFGYLLFAIPISFLTTLFPSINGIGVRDWSYVILLSKINVPKEIAVSISLLVVAIQMFISIFGGIFWMFEKNNTNVKQMVEES